MKKNRLIFWIATHTLFEFVITAMIFVLLTNPLWRIFLLTWWGIRFVFFWGLTRHYKELTGGKVGETLEVQRV